MNNIHMDQADHILINWYYFRHMNHRTETSRIILLGTGTPNAEPDRSGPSLALITGGISYLVDSGPGVVRQANKAFKNGITELEASKLNLAFLTHLHSDHTAGLPDLILTPWVLGREEPLVIYGPSGLKSMTAQILSAYETDILERTHSLQPSDDSGYKVDAHEIEPGIIYRDGNVSIEAFRVNHGSLDAFGYRFYLPDRIVTISGDTAPFDGQADVYSGSDILIHEVYSNKGFLNYPPEWQKYHASVHTSATELAEIASVVKPDLLILYHQLLNGVTEEELLDEIRAEYSGEVVSGHDLDIF